MKTEISTPNLFTFCSILFVFIHTCEACHLCKWDPWGSWSICCHGSKVRVRGGICNDAPSIYDCKSHRQATSCVDDCYNGGYSSGNACSCPDHSYGDCCEHSK